MQRAVEECLGGKIGHSICMFYVVSFLLSGSEMGCQ